MVLFLICASQLVVVDDDCLLEIYRYSSLIMRREGVHRDQQRH